MMNFVFSRDGQYRKLPPRSIADAGLSWQKVQGREATRHRHRLPEPTPKALCPPRAPPPKTAVG